MTSRFAPRWLFALLTAGAIVLFVSLGFWQWQRGEYRQVVWDEFRRSDAPAVDANASALAGLPRFTRVRLEGDFVPARQFLLDNISHAGAPGYEVLTVFELGDGSRLLVNRGWVPFSGYREQLPEVDFDPAGHGRISGRLSALPVAGLESGRVPPSADGGWPKVASFPTHAQLQQAYGAPLLPVVLLLDADSGPGYLRDWQPPGVPPERNFGYAVQWWSFALLALVLFVGFNLKRRNG